MMWEFIEEITRRKRRGMVLPMQGESHFYYETSCSDKRELFHVNYLDIS
jgi:hypothetical protein